MSDKGVDSLVNQNNTPGAAVLFFYIYTGTQLAVGSHNAMGPKNNFEFSYWGLHTVALTI